MALTNASGTVQERMKYDAFGSVTWMDAAFATKSSSGYAWNRTFTGQVRDSELGLMLYRNRYYSTGLGRFINRNLIGYLAGDVNLYRYVGNMPVDALDPLGLDVCDWVAWGSNGALGVLEFGAGAIDGATFGITGGLRSGAYGLAGYQYNYGTAYSVGTVVGITSTSVTVAGAGRSAIRSIRPQTVYRVFGGGSSGYGRSWTPVNPNSVRNFRNAAGLPNQNTGQFVARGTVRPSNIQVRKPADPLNGNAGGLPEYIIDPNKVKINNISGVNPPF